MERRKDGKARRRYRTLAGTLFFARDIFIQVGQLALEIAAHGFDRGDAALHFVNLESGFRRSSVSVRFIPLSLPRYPEYPSARHSLRLTSPAHPSLCPQKGFPKAAVKASLRFYFQDSCQS